MKQILTFKLNNQEYGVLASNIIEIISIPKITDLFVENKYVKGLLMIRSIPILLIDTPLILNIDNFKYNNKTEIVVLKENGLKYAITIGKTQQLKTFKIIENKDKNLYHGFVKDQDNLIPILDIKSILQFI